MFVWSVSHLDEPGLANRHLLDDADLLEESAGAFIMCAESMPNLWWNTASSSHVIIKPPAK